METSLKQNVRFSVRSSAEELSLPVSIKVFITLKLYGMVFE